MGKCHMCKEELEFDCTGVEDTVVCGKCFRRLSDPTLGREENNMEKLGVDEGIDQEKLEKMASEGCPQCGGEVERHGDILSCKNCGTEPFEQK